MLSGIGSEEVQPFSLSLEAEMMLERLKEQHLQQMEEFQEQLEIKVNLMLLKVSVEAKTFWGHAALLLSRFQPLSRLASYFSASFI